MPFVGAVLRHALGGAHVRSDQSELGRRKAERIQALEARGHVRVVAAAGQPGAIDRPDGVADLAGQTIVVGTIERAGKSVMGMRVFPAVTSICVVRYR